jgi:hypothetical protein
MDAATLDPQAVAISAVAGPLIRDDDDAPRPAEPVHGRDSGLGAPCRWDRGPDQGDRRDDPSHRALAQGLEACNGWTFWHVEKKGGLTSINNFRAEIRATMSIAAE